VTKFAFDQRLINIKILECLFDIEKWSISTNQSIFIKYLNRAPRS